MPTSDVKAPVFTPLGACKPCNERTSSARLLTMPQCARCGAMLCACPCVPQQRSERARLHVWVRERLPSRSQGRLASEVLSLAQLPGERHAPIGAFGRFLTLSLSLSPLSRARTYALLDEILVERHPKPTHTASAPATATAVLPRTLLQGTFALSQRRPIATTTRWKF